MVSKVANGGLGITPWVVHLLAHRIKCAIANAVIEGELLNENFGRLPWTLMLFVQLSFHFAGEYAWICVRINVADGVLGPSRVGRQAVLP